MKASKSLRLLMIGGLVIAGAMALHAEDEDNDSANLRKKAKDEWYNESYGREARRGGPWTPAYRRFMLEAATRERLRWANKMPGAAPVAGSTWVNIGPTKADYIENGPFKLTQTDSGRVRDIIPNPGNPAIIYLATAAGGVWKSTNSGANWVPITETIGSLSVGALAMDPQATNTLYLGLGDPFDGTGVGLLKTTDGGSTWSAPVFLGDSTFTADLIVSPNNRAVVLAATNKGLYRSTDSGSNWTLVSLATGQAELPYAWSLAHAGGANFVLTVEALSSATTGTTDGQIWWSSDDGATWTRAAGFTKSTGLGRATVAASKTNPNIVYALAAIPNPTTAVDFADIFKSTDAGRTWTALGADAKRFSNGNRETRKVNEIFSGQGWYDQMLIVSPSDPNTFYFGGALLMAKSTNGGSSYSQLTNWLAQFGLPYVHADFHAAAFDVAGNFYVGTDGGIFKSTDGGTSWSSALNTGITTHMLYSVCSSSNNVNAVLGGMQDNGTRLRSGATTTYNQEIGGDGIGCDISQTNANLMLGSVFYTDINKSTDGGLNFVPACSGIAECKNSSAAPFLTRIASWPGDPTGNTLFTIVNTKVYKTTNYATSWSALGVTGLPTSSLFFRNLNVFKGNSNIVGVVANSGRVFLTSNGGTSWFQAGALPNNGLSLSYIWFDETNSNTIYVSSVAPDATKNHLWKSTDFGTSWTAIDGGGFPFGIPVDTIRTDPGSNTTLYAGTHLGVYKSTDAGATWTRFGTGLPLVQVADLYISADGTIMRAGSYGRGFWQIQ